MATPEQRLEELGIVLPEAPRPLAAYVPTVRSGSMVYVSGQVPMVDGKVAYAGRLGASGLSVEDGAQAARRCAINVLAALKAELGQLSRVRRVVKLTGFVASEPDFVDQPKVVNAASELLVEVFGDAGKHARSAVGMASLPLGVPVEVEAIVEVE
ncbi:MAG TPA: RidA family protein [Actinomycetes bacterium]|jgi:enamine deaminase RidA (YjgF/YER057c/UK114 family)|nr:RidA family protein [Actinomycetes bacterium]